MPNDSIVTITRRELAWAILLWGMVVSLFLAPVLLTGRVWSPADLLYDYAPWSAQAPGGWAGASNGLLADDVLVFEPWFQASAARLHTGALPLWQPDNMLGAPALGNMQSAVFDPLNWPYFVWPDPALLVVRAWLKLFLLALGMYVLARTTLRVRPLAAIVAVLPFTFGAFVTVWLLYPHTAAIVWLPWLWWATARFLAQPAPRPLVGVAALVTLTLLAGQPEMAYQIALGSGLFAALVAWQAAPRQWGRIAGRLGLWGVAYGLGTAGAAIQLAPFWEYLSQSSGLISRSGAAAVDAGLPFRYFWTALVPDLFGNPAQHNWWATVSNYNETNVYCGLLPWLLAPFALRRRDRHTQALAVLLIVASLVALGTVYGWPLIRGAVQAIPLMQLVAGGRLVVLVQFALALLAALGAEALLERLGERQPRRLWALAVILPAVGGGALVFPVLIAQGVFLLPADATVRATWTAALVRSTAVLLPTVALLAAVLVLGQRRPAWGRIAFLGGVGLLAADLAAVHSTYNPTVDRSAYYPATPLTDYLRTRPGLFRFAALDATLMPNTNLRYGLANFAGYDALLPRSYHQAVVRIDPQVPALGYTPYHILQSPLLNLFNVHYLIASPDHDPNYRSDQRQEIGGHFAAEIQGTQQIGQTFVAGTDQLAEVQVRGATYGRALAGEVVFHLKTDPGSATDLVTQAVPGARLGEGQWWVFHFPPIAAAKGRAFYFYLDAPATPVGQGGTVAYSEGDPYLAGSRVVAGQPAAGDLMFRTASLPPGDSDGRWFLPVWDGGARGVTVYENQRVLPRAWLTHQVVVETDSARRLDRLTAPTFDGAITAVLDAPLPVDQPLPSVRPGAADQVTMRRYDPEAVDIASDSPAAGLLILADQAFPGWEATVDNRPVAIHTTDHALRGVYLPAGAHLVQFRYRPASLRWGAAISTVAGLAALGFVVLPLRRRARP